MSSIAKSVFVVGACALAMAVACGNDGGGEPGNCPNVAGQWTIASHCEASFVGATMTLAQNGCAITVTQAPWSSGWAGSITAEGAVTMSGPADNETLTCTGNLSGNTFSMSCSPGTCDVTVSKGGGGGGGGGGGLSGDPTVGKTCGAPTDCASPYFCNKAGFCTGTCSAHVDCGCASNQSECKNACVALDATSSICLRLCNTNSDCDVGTCEAALKSGGKVCVTTGG
ncbi:MAG: hypothetical protein KC503_20670 [Myxococcales bacterium]|nr:hypothetical protein [Myxococcales bacterium]